MISLARDTISEEDIKNLVYWLCSNPRLTKGKVTEEFEEAWSRWLGVKYSVFVNSGSSANLAAIYSLIQSGRMKNKNVIVPAVSWVTTVSPVIQLGLNPILCEASSTDLGINIHHLEELCWKYKPAALVLVHVLGNPCQLDRIMQICHKYDVILIEDSCESPGSFFDGQMVGTFGLMSTFSFYFGHHISTIEGGMISTNDERMFNILKSVRSHGWLRDLDERERKRLRGKKKKDEFRELYEFHYPGMNLRSTDLQAFIGLGQMKKIDKICNRRNVNFKLYDELIQNKYWKLLTDDRRYVSNFAYPIITPKIKKVVKALNKARVENRPLVCGSMGRQPFWEKLFGTSNFPFANEVHDKGLYVPNNHMMAEKEIRFICDIINKVIN